MDLDTCKLINIDNSRRMWTVSLSMSDHLDDVDTGKHCNMDDCEWNNIVLTNEAL